MTDTLSPIERGKRMGLIRGRDTTPERAVRGLLHRLGYRFRLHPKDLPGRPDVVFRWRRKAIFVHGCFWHRHPDPSCRLARLPKSRLEFWGPKLEANRLRDMEGLSHPNHRFQPGARSYPGHTGSPLDEPAKTLKAGVHGVPGGENMLRRPDGGIRYFTVRESARLQTFPDDFSFHGSWSESMRQLGNAVPVTLAAIIAQSIASHLRGLAGARHRSTNIGTRHERPALQPA